MTKDQRSASAGLRRAKPTTKDQNTVVSVVCALHDGAAVEPFLRRTDEVMRAHFRFFEIVLVDDGSGEDTRGELDTLLKDVENIRTMRLSRRFGHDIALSAGIESAIGDFVVTLDMACDPPEEIPRLVAACRAGEGVVHGVAENVPDRGAIREALGRFFRSYCRRRLGVDLDRGSGAFRVMSRQAVNALLQVQVQNRYLRVLTGSLGYGQETVSYKLREGTAPPARPLHEEIATAVDLIAANTRHPLRLVTWTGLAAATLNVLYAVYVVIIYLAKPDVAEGWTTQSLQHSGMFFLLFLILTVLSEYIGTLVAEVRSRPLYFVAGEKNSTVLLEDTVKSSIVKESE